VQIYKELLSARLDWLPCCCRNTSRAGSLEARNTVLHRTFVLSLVRDLSVFPSLALSVFELHEHTPPVALLFG
jgi:hypothetical protein